MAALTVSSADEKKVKALGFLNNRGTDNFSARIITVNGKITADQQQCIAEAARLYGNGNITFTTRLTLEVQGVAYDNIEDFRTYIAKAGLETGGTGSKVRPVVSCKGTTCQYGLIDTFALSEEIHKRFYKGYNQVKLPHKFKIAVGGCPNNCVKPNLNDLGIIGQRIPDFDEESCNGCLKCSVEESCPIKAAKLDDDLLNIDREMCNNCGRCIGACHFDASESGITGYKIYLGGMWGKRVQHGRALKKIFTSEEEALDTIEKVILFYREQGKTGERFAQTIQRIGFEQVEKEILDDAIMARKQEILDAKLHETGGATC